jgi:hypothetical protein
MMITFLTYISTTPRPAFIWGFSFSPRPFWVFTYERRESCNELLQQLTCVLAGFVRVLGACHESSWLADCLAVVRTGRVSDHDCGSYSGWNETRHS